MKTGREWREVACQRCVWMCDGRPCYQCIEKTIADAMAEARADEAEKWRSGLARALGRPLDSITTAEKIVEHIRAEGRREGLEAAARLLQQHEIQDPGPFAIAIRALADEVEK